MKTITTLLTLIITLLTNAQQTAITESGKKVILHDNGKWEFAKTDTGATKTITKSFIKSESAKNFIRSEKNNFGIWYDSKKWKKEKDADNEDAEFQFQLAKGDGYAMAITERIEIDVENLKEIALENARGAAPDIALELEEDRIINGHKVKCLQMTGTASGIKFTYFGYYTSNESGTIQLVCFTGKSLMKEYRKDFEDFLNGLVALKEEKKEE